MRGVVKGHEKGSVLNKHEDVFRDVVEGFVKGRNEVVSE